MSKEELFTIKDINGNYVSIDSVDLYEALKIQNFKLFGMDMLSILEMRKQYLYRHAKLPITVETIKEMYSKYPVISL